MPTISRLISTGMAAATVFAALASTSAQAHGIWFAQRARQLALVYGVGADDLDAVKRLPLIKSVDGFDADGLPVTTSLPVPESRVSANREPTTRSSPSPPLRPRLSTARAERIW